MGALVAAAAAFLADRGRNVPARALVRVGLPKDLADDLVQEVLIRAYRAELRGDVVDNIEAFVTTLVHRAAVDLIRGVRRRPEGHPPEHRPDDEPIDTLADAVLTDLEAIAGLLGVELRQRLGSQLADHPVAAAGALVVLAIAVDGAAPADDCPAPAGGAGDDEAAVWAGLFYAGERRCFPGPRTPEDAAMRQRRSRAVRRQRALLRVLLTELGVLAGGPDG